MKEKKDPTASSAPVTTATKAEEPKAPEQLTEVEALTLANLALHRQLYEAQIGSKYKLTPADRIGPDGRTIIRG